jgi:hypothetical protein
MNDSDDSSQFFIIVFELISSPPDSVRNINTCQKGIEAEIAKI